MNCTPKVSCLTFEAQFIFLLLDSLFFIYIFFLSFSNKFELLNTIF